MPSTPSTLRFRKITHLGLSAQAINFAQSSFMGHRVSFNVPVDFMNEYFTWTRATEEARPTGRFVADPGANPAYASTGPKDMPTFTEMLERAFGSAYTDLDAVAEGLNYSSPALDSTGDMKRNDNITNYTWAYDDKGAGTDTLVSNQHYSVNDLVMAFVLNKCFGSSAYDAWEIVYNLPDAFGMLTDLQLAIAINDSLQAEEDKAEANVLPTKTLATQSPGDDKGRVDEMFRALLSMDPQRFYKNGTQIDGLFESNPDVAGSGNWCLGVGDKIEIPVRLYFRAPVTVLSVVDNAKNPSSATPDQVETVFIKGEDATSFGQNPTALEVASADRGNVMSLRLQILCSDPVMVSGETRATSEDAAATPPAPAVAVAVNPIFYDGANYKTQKAIAVVFANLGDTTKWEITTATDGDLVAIVGLSFSFLNGVLELTYDPSVNLSVPSVTEVDILLEYTGTASPAPAPPPGKTITITISAPPA
jgi:hypothetical protein